jgi:hypothetical protein
LTTPDRIRTCNLWLRRQNGIGCETASPANPDNDLGKTLSPDAVRLAHVLRAADSDLGRIIEGWDTLDAGKQRMVLAVFDAAGGAR